jgi:integrase
MSDTMRKRTKSWSESIGPYRNRIRIFKDPSSAIIYAEYRDPSRPGRYRSVSLRHRDEQRARLWAKEQVGRWMAGESQLRDQTPTLARVLANYLSHRTSRKVFSEQKADHRRARMWTRWLGANKDISTLSLREWEGFIESRRSGAIDAQGEPVSAERRQEVRDGTVAADLVFLLTVLNWAAKWRTHDGRYLMRENPARGYRIPAEKNPRRPVVSEDRFQKVRAKAEQVMMVVGRGKNQREQRSYLSEILDLVNGTGRRISAVLALQYADLKPSEGPHGSIRWRAETDKMRKEWTVPISVEVRAAINRILAERPGIGPALLFPAVNDPSRPIAVEVVSEWLLKAEKLAGVEKQNGSLWHAYRRKWATERKYLPAADVAAAGGWSDQATLTHVYQQADRETMYRVVSEPTRLRA